MFALRVGKFPVLFSIFLVGLIFGIFITSMVSQPSPITIDEGQIAPLTDRDYFTTVNSLLSSANRSIHMIMFDLRYYPEYPESPGNYLLSSLSEAASRGVDVRVITDEYLTEKPLVNMLREKGVNIKFDSKDVTTHAKLIIIDSKFVIIGSTNWSYHSLEKNHEANVLIHSPSLAEEFERYFEKLWAES